MSHRTQVTIAGTTHNPGRFGWRCSCGALTPLVPDGPFDSWDEAEQAGKTHEHLAATS